MVELEKVGKLESPVELFGSPYFVGRLEKSRRITREKGGETGFFIGSVGGDFYAGEVVEPELRDCEWSLTDVYGRSFFRGLGENFDNLGGFCEYSSDVYGVVSYHLHGKSGNFVPSDFDLDSFFRERGEWPRAPIMAIGSLKSGGGRLEVLALQEGREKSIFREGDLSRDFCVGSEMAYDLLLDYPDEDIFELSNREAYERVKRLGKLGIRTAFLEYRKKGGSLCLCKTTDSVLEFSF